MFVYSVKTSKAKIAALVIAIIAIVIAIAMIMTGEKEPAANDSAVNYKAENSAERIAFISQFGWKISDDPVEISEVIIPEDFDAGYVEYAAMNKAQGLELEPYKGVRAKRWTYDVLNYPGLESHPNHEVAKKQMRNFGAMMSFIVKGGKPAGEKLLNSLELCTLAVSLGSDQTLIEHPASMTHSTYDPQALVEAGVPAGLVRLSVGLENVEDIIEDLAKGLELI